MAWLYVKKERARAAIAATHRHSRADVHAEHYWKPHSHLAGWGLSPAGPQRTANARSTRKPSIARKAGHAHRCPSDHEPLSGGGDDLHGRLAGPAATRASAAAAGLDRLGLARHGDLLAALRGAGGR